MEIKEIIDAFDDVNWRDDILHVYTAEVINEANKLLKKYIPAKVSTNDFDSPLCPSCKKMFYMLNQPYCPNCGQSLDWNDFNAAKKKNYIGY